MATIIRKALSAVMGPFPTVGRTVTYLVENPVATSASTGALVSVCPSVVVGDELHQKFGVELGSKVDGVWHICIAPAEGYEYTTLAIKDSSTCKQLVWMGDSIQLSRTGIALTFNGTLDAKLEASSLPVFHVKRHNSLIGITPMGFPALYSFNLCSDRLRYIASWPERYDRGSYYNTYRVQQQKTMVHLAEQAVFKNLWAEQADSMHFVYKCRLDVTGNVFCRYVGIHFPRIEGYTWVLAGMEVVEGTVVIPVAGNGVAAGVGWTVRADCRIAPLEPGFTVSFQKFDAVVGEDPMPSGWCGHWSEGASEYGNCSCVGCVAGV